MLMLLDPSDDAGGQARAGRRPRAGRGAAAPCCRRSDGGCAKSRSALDYPYWIDDPGLRSRVPRSRLALAPPLTDEKLATQVARIAARPLDRARPLWELYLIHGLEHGHVGAAHEDPSRGRRRDVGSRAPRRAAGHRARGSRRSARRRMAASGPAAGRSRDVRSRAGRIASVLRSAQCGHCRRACRTSRTTRSSPGFQAPGRSGAPREARARGHAGSRRRSNARRSSRRGRPSTVAYRRTGGSPSGNCRSSTRRRSRIEHGCTLNDVIVTVCAGAVRRWLIEHDELPDGPLVAQVPISVRTETSAARSATASG